MHSRRMGRGLLVCAVLSALYGVADAQTAPARRTDLAVEAQRQTQLSPQEQVVQGSAIIAKTAVTATNVRHMLEQARAQRDVVKTLCLNDKLNQIDVAGRSAQERQAALEQAAGRNDADLSNHEFMILTVLKQRVEQLGFEANQCVGAETGFVGATSVTSRVDPGQPSEDPSTHPEVGLVSLPPVCASCTY
jgi:hypothetical protein